MKIKTKVYLTLPRILKWNRKAKRIAKKSLRDEMAAEKYPVEWKNAWLLKRAKKVSKKLNINLIVNGFEDLPKAPYILAPNHTSSYDAALILQALENPSEASDARNAIPLFIAKDDVKENKRLKGLADLMETFYLSRSKPREALATLEGWATFAKENNRVAVIFPEGTRSKDGNIKEFKGGAFKMAKKAYLPVVPVTINNGLSITDLSRTGKLDVEVTFHKVIKPSSFIAMDNKSLAIKVEKVVKSAWKKPDGKRSSNEDKIT